MLSLEMSAIKACPATTRSCSPSSRVFDMMAWRRSRREMLTEAEGGTFDWAFKDAELKLRGRNWLWEKVKLTFKPWLEGDGEGMFCFVGKPGSGKYTFMKFLTHHPDIDRASQAWLPGKRLLRAEHFFWIAGIGLQKSYVGLLRSLLRQCLLAMSGSESETDVQLVRDALQSRWSSLKVHAAWDSGELERVISRLVLSLPDTKCFFLVDGLDEREPKEQLDELARKMVWISQLPNVKLCVSCRPWHGLTQNLTFDAMLCIDQLTYSDMEFYLQSRLRRARTIAPIHSDFQEKTAQVERLMHDIIHAAEGVFLWLELMANELVRAICKNSNLKGLRRVFEESPPDLNAYLTTQIYQRIPKGKSNVSGTASALKLAMVIHKNDERPSVFFDNPQSVVNFWLLQNGYLTEEMSWYNMGVRLFSMPEREQMAQATKRFLSESCRDLVVTHRTPHFNSNAEFIHRSVFDFLNSGDIKLEIEKASPKHFEDDDFLDKLSKMRPLLLFRGLDLCCFQMHSAMAEIVNQFFEKQRCERRFLSVCDRILAEHVLDTCACFGQLHQFDNQAIPTLLQNDCTESVLALFRRWPHVATFGLFWLNGIDWNFYSELLGGYLNFPSISISELIKFVLMCGLPLNRLCNRYQQCGNTLWAKWLVESKRRAAGTHSTVDALRRWQKQTAEVASLMIQHGADPTCLVCVAKHPDQASCIHVSIDDVFDSLFHPGYISQMRSLLAECSRKTQYRSAQRKQRLRGVRVFLYSVQSDHANERLAKNDRDDAPFWRDQRIGIVTWFLHDCMNGGETTKTCLTDSSPSDHHRSFVASYCKDCDRDVSLCVTCFYSWDGTYDLLVANAFGNSEIANPRCVHAILISSFHKSEASSSEDFADQVLDAIREWYQSDPLFEEEIIWPSRTRGQEMHSFISESATDPEESD